MKNFWLFVLLILLLSCKKEDIPNIFGHSNPPNVLLIIADDLGKDALQGFSEGSIKPNTPNINLLRSKGLLFNNFWVNPTCSPTRSSIITGKYGYRTGVLWANDELSPSEQTLQQYIAQESGNTYSTAIIGKWHLSGDEPEVNPESFGIDYFAGLLRGAVNDYYQWQFTESGSSSLETEYTSTKFTNQSIEWISNQSNPWFLWLAYNAPHTPFHAPPSQMHSQGDLPEYTSGLDPMPYYMAAIEAMDYQIGKLIQSIPHAVLENTVIIFVGDNGTPNQVAQFPFTSNTVKGTLYQGGVNVPMIIAGKGVSRTGTDNNLICNTDLFSTIANLTGVSNNEIHDSKSFKALLSSNYNHRDFQYTDMNNGTDDKWAISDGSYKLIVDASGTEEMYQLSTDPYENINLLLNTLSLEAQNAKTALELELLNIRN